MIDSKPTIDGSSEEYQNGVFGFSHEEGGGLDETLALATIGFSQEKGVKIVEGFSLVFVGFEVHG
jgi:hypothetical protein